MKFISFLDAHAGALTFLATAVYVIATIAICWANIKSANATKKQVKESKLQYEESKRLQIAPQLLTRYSREHYSPDNYVSFTLLPETIIEQCRISCFCLIFENVGLGAAISLTATSSNLYSVDGEYQLINTAIYPKECLICEIDLGLSDNSICNSITMRPEININYTDILGYMYEQKIIVDIVAQKGEYIKINDVEISKPQVIKGSN